VEGWNLARHHHDAAFYLLDCTFSRSMIDRAPFRVIYPLGGKQPTDADIAKNKELDKTNIWGERAYFHNCHRDGGGDYAWHADNLGDAEGSPKAEQITPAWTFAGKWDPERTDGPKIRGIATRDGKIAVTFDERVTVKGKPRLAMGGEKFGDYVSGSGGETIIFDGSNATANEATIDLNGGAIIASEAGAKIRGMGL
jgi:pectinesterase